MAPRKLPPGRHGLSREEVAESQRERMMRGMAEAAVDLGYANVTVADVLKCAGVSRETFYEHFANKEACFLAGYDAVVEKLLEELQEAFSEEAGTASPEPIDQFERFLARYLEVVQQEPALARAALIESYAAGPAALARRNEGQSVGIEMMASLLKAQDERRRFACEAVFAATIGIVTRRVAAGQTAGLDELHAPLMDFTRTSLQAMGVGGEASAPGQVEPAGRSTR